MGREGGREGSFFGYWRRRKRGKREAQILRGESQVCGAPFKALDPFLSALRRREGEESLRFRMEGCCSFCDDREREEGEEVFLERVNL